MNTTEIIRICNTTKVDSVMSISNTLVQYGLIGSFETLTMLEGERVAIVGKDGEEVSFFELQFNYENLARQLSFRLGIQAGDKIIGICRDYACAEVSCFLACIRIGCAFIPLDASMIEKTDTASRIIRNANPSAAVVVADSESDPMLFALSRLGVHRCVLLRPDGTISYENITDVPLLPPYDRTMVGSKPLYILYTSGSTGVPKGVQGTEKGLCNRLCWQFRRFPFQEGDLVCRRTPITFVDAVAEIFGALLGGATLWLPSGGRVMREGVTKELVTEAALAGVTHITMLPSQLRAMLQLHPQLGMTWSSLRMLVVSGEAMDQTLAMQFLAVAPQATLVNLYGSTEVAGDVTYAVLATSRKFSSKQRERSRKKRKRGRRNMKVVECSNEEGVFLCIDQKENQASLPPHTKLISPIGACIDGNILVVASPNSSGDGFSRTPIGEAGELFVGGPQVAMGYFNNQEESDLRFLRDPFDSSDDIYFRTGDLVQWRADGALMWLGRVDRQVKVRGVRVELDSAQVELLAALGVSSGMAVVATAWESARRQPSSNMDALTPYAETRLFAFIEREASLRCGVTNLRSFRARVLGKVTAIHIPAAVMFVRELPRTGPGKISYAALRSYVNSLASTNKVRSTQEALLWPDGYNRSAEAYLWTLFEELLPQLQLEACDVLDLTSAPNEFGSLDRRRDRDLSFFDMGGDSLLAVEAQWRVKKDTGVDISMDSLLLPFAALSEMIQCQVMQAANAEDQTPPFQVATANQVADDTRSTELPAYPGLSNGAIDEAHVGADHVDDPPGGSHSHVAGLGRPVDWVGHLKPLTYLSQSSVPVPEALAGKELRLQEKWRSELPRCIDASPMLLLFIGRQQRFANDGGGDIEVGLVFIGSHGGDFNCIRADTGEKVWTRLLGEREHVEGSAVCRMSDEGGGVIFVCSHYGIDVDGVAESGKLNGHAAQDESQDHRGSLWALDMMTGHILWRYRTRGEIKGTPTIHQLDTMPYVWAGSHDGGLYRCDYRTGRLSARQQCGGAIFSSPVLSFDEKSIYVACTDSRGSVHCFDTEKLGPLWTLALGSPVFATPCYYQSGSNSDIVVGSVDGLLKRLSSSGVVLWAATATRPVFSSPCISMLMTGIGSIPTVIWGSHDMQLRCARIEDGVEVWRTDLQSAIFSSPFVRREIVFASTTAGVLFCLRHSDGLILSRVRLSGEVYSSPVVHNDLVMLGCRDNNLYAFNYYIST